MKTFGPNHGQRLELRADDRLRALLDSAHEAFISMDSTGHVLVWNQMASETFGWSEEEARGRRLEDLIVPERHREEQQADMRQLVAAGGGAGVKRRVETEALHRDGHELPIELTVAPMQTPTGTVVNAFLHDISDRREAEAGARRLAALVNGSQDAIIASDLDGRLTDWNPGAERLYGYSVEEALGESVSILRPESEHDHVMERLSAIEADEHLPTYETSHRRKDGSSADVSVSLSGVRDGSGRVVGVAAIIRDISGRVSSDRSLQEARQRFQTAFERAPNGMALVHPDGGWLSVNPALCRLVGREPVDLLARNFLSITHPGDVASSRTQVQRTLAGELDGFEMDKRYVLPDESVVWAQVSAALVREAGGEPGYFIVQMQDISERKAAEEGLRSYGEHLNQLALEDPVTGLRTSRDLHAVLDAEISRSRRYDRRWSVVLLDIDGFREINATAGHVGGDRVLRHVAEAIEQARRASDLSARTGGDEFALLLPETAGEAAKLTARRIAAEILAKTGGVSVSVGTASWPEDGESKELVLMHADMQLETAKPLASSSAASAGAFAEDRIRRILSLGREQLGMDVAYVSALTPTNQVYEVISGEADSFGVEEGVELPLAATYCQRMLEGRIPNAVPDTGEKSVLGALPTTAEAGIGSYVGVPIELSSGRTYGTFCCISHDPNPAIAQRHVALMRFLADLIAEEIERDENERTQRRAYGELTGVHALLSALTARDHYTSEHSQTVVRLATDVAQRLGLTEKRVEEVEQVALLHDIGKVGIPDSILQKPYALNEQEWELMHQHPAIGARIVVGTETLSHLGAAVRAEHERWDGTGYPDGLAGEAIPLASRITLVCDAYDAMTSDRAYRKALPRDVAIEEIAGGAGSQFCPKSARALLDILN